MPRPDESPEVTIERIAANARLFSLSTGSVMERSAYRSVAQACTDFLGTTGHPSARPNLPIEAIALVAHDRAVYGLSERSRNAMNLVNTIRYTNLTRSELRTPRAMARYLEALYELVKKSAMDTARHTAQNAQAALNWFRSAVHTRAQIASLVSSMDLMTKSDRCQSQTDPDSVCCRYHRTRFDIVAAAGSLHGLLFESCFSLHPETADANVELSVHCSSDEQIYIWPSEDSVDCVSCHGLDLWLGRPYRPTRSHRMPNSHNAADIINWHRSTHAVDPALPGLILHRAAAVTDTIYS